jgi:hypothetical protein
MRVEHLHGGLAGKEMIPSSRAKARSCQYPTGVLSGAPRGCNFEGVSSEAKKTKIRIRSNKMQHLAIPGAKRVPTSLYDFKHIMGL